MKPLCVDLYAGLGGWSDGFLFPPRSPAVFFLAMPLYRW
jgi:hypothetical protein